jgi:hypothetical protein
MTILTSLAACLLLAGPAAPPEGAATSPGVVDASGTFRGARWGMKVDEVRALFKGDAKPVEPELKLADGNVVALRMDGLQLAGRTVRAGFVFAGGGLALVSLRTLEREYAPPEAFEAASKAIGDAFGGPGKITKDDNFVDMRQATWARPQGVVDLKYIPGVLVLMYSPPPAAEPPPLLKRP